MVEKIITQENYGFEKPDAIFIENMTERGDFEEMQLMMRGGNDNYTGMNNHLQTQQGYNHYQTMNLFHIMVGVNLILLAGLLLSLTRYFWIKADRK